MMTCEKMLHCVQHDKKSWLRQWLRRTCPLGFGSEHSEESAVILMLDT